MKKALIIGAGYFGKHLVFELIENGFTVDVIDKAELPRYTLSGSGCKYIEMNAWNLPIIQEITIPEYDCCYICLGENKSMIIHVIEKLREAGARSIVVRIKNKQDEEVFVQAGADKTFCPAKVASLVIVKELIDQGSVDAFDVSE